MLTSEMKLKVLGGINNGVPVSQMCNKLNYRNCVVNDWQGIKKSLHDFSKQIEL